MMSYMSVGHMFVAGGYRPNEEIRVGLLGANYAIEHDRYRITASLPPDLESRLHAPLAQPGLKVKTGDYMLAVNGKADPRRQTSTRPSKTWPTKVSP